MAINTRNIPVAPQPSAQMNYQFLKNFSPSAAHTWNDSYLRITFYSSVAVTAVASWELYLTDGTLPQNSISQGQTGTTTDTIRDGASPILVPLREGFLYSLRVSTTTVVKRGQCFVIAEIIRGANAAPVFVGQSLFAAYLTTNAPLTFPGSPVAAPTDGTGAILSYSQAQPPAGTAVTVTTPANTRWRLISVNGLLVTSAAAGNRAIFLNTTPALGTNETPFSLAIPPSTNALYWFTLYANSRETYIRTGETDWQIYLPPIILTSAAQFSVSADNLQGADQFTGGTTYSVEEWVEF